MTTAIAIIKDGKVFRVEAPRSAKIWNGAPSGCDFDMVSVEGDFYLARHVLDMARTEKRGFRLIGFEPLPD